MANAPNTPANGTTAFRVDTEAINNREAYASHEVLITYAARKSPCRKNVWREVALSWGPFLVIVLLWIWFYRRNSRGKTKKSYVELVEELTDISQDTAVQTKRIADSLEKLTDKEK